MPFNTYLGREVKVTPAPGTKDRWGVWSRIDPFVRLKTLCPCESGKLFNECHGTIPDSYWDNVIELPAPQVDS